MGGCSRFFSPEKWTIISDLTFRWFSELHDLQAIGFPQTSLVEYHMELAIFQFALSTMDCASLVEKYLVK